MARFNNQWFVMARSTFEEFLSSNRSVSGMFGCGHVGNGAGENPATEEIPARAKIARFARSRRSVHLDHNGRVVSETTAVSDSAIDIYMEPDPETTRMVRGTRSPQHR